MAEHKMDFPSNSSKNKLPKPTGTPKPEKNVEKVVSGVAVQRKKSLGSKIKETFAGDDARSVGMYLLFDVIIPASKNMLAEAASQGAERMLFGDSRGRIRSGSGNRSGHTSYKSMHRSDSDRDAPRSLSARARATHDFEDIIINDRGEAEDVLDQLAELVAKFGMATVSDLYELVGITGDFTDAKYGWYELRTARVRRVRDGYLIDLPRPGVLE